MPQALIDLLWRDSPGAPSRGARGPRSRRSTDDVVAQAVAIADDSGIDAVTIRTLAKALGITPMAVYTHVNSRDDLLVLMADHSYAQMNLAPFGRSSWRTRVRRVARDNLAHLREQPWLLGIDDPRLALGPGTIAKYDHELRAFDATGLTDLQRDAALTFVIDFVHASAARLVQPASAFDSIWEQSADRLAGYLGENFTLAQTVGRAAGEAMGGPYDAEHAWRFGMARIIAGLGNLISADAEGS